MVEKSDKERKEALWKKIVDHIAVDHERDRGNGNRREVEESKSGGAERGGPGIEKADENQPPDSYRRPSEEP